MTKSLLERAAELLEVEEPSLRWHRACGEWLRDYKRRCRADYHGGDEMPDHRGCPEGAECEGKRDNIYWRPEST